MATNFLDLTKKHVVAESTALAATRGDGRIINMEINQSLDNGKFLKKGAYLRPEIYQGEVPAAGDAVYLVLSVPLMYEEFSTITNDESYFYNAAGDKLRCYPLKAGEDVMTISADGIEALATAPVIGNLVVTDGVDLVEVAAATDVSAKGFVGKIIEKVTKSNRTSYRIEIEKNATVVVQA